MSNVKKGDLFTLHKTSEPNSRVDNAIALQDDPEPFKAYHETKGVIEVDDNYLIPKVIEDKFPEFVNRVTDSIKNELGEDLWRQLEEQARSSSQDIVEQILDNYLDYLVQNYDKLDAANQAIQDTGLDILIDYGADIASLIVEIFITIV